MDHDDARAELQKLISERREDYAGLSRLLGQDVSRTTLSWTRGAGGIISTTHDMTVWEQALYHGRLLPQRQQAELRSLVSSKTGRPIKHTTPNDPEGFGLGIA